MGDKPSADEILADNVRRLLDATVRQDDGGPVTPVEVEEKTKGAITKSTIYRILNREVGAKIEHIEALGKAFGLPAWAMLVPGLDPADPPTLTTRAAFEAKVLERSEQIVTAMMNSLFEQRKHGPSGRSLGAPPDSEVPDQGKSNGTEYPPAET